MAHNDKLAEVHDRLIAAIDNLVSGDDWRRFLEVSQRLHAYSPNNVLLILAQRPTASRAAGYRTWRSLGYQVRRGEKGIAVLAPIVTRRRPVDIDDELEHPEVVRILGGFRVVYVFDIEQCDGPPWPDVRPALLTGDAPGALWDLLAAQVDAAGFSIERGACAGANGRTDFDARSVRVRDDVAPAQAVKTLAHELAHVLLHDGTEYATGCRGRAEIEAESVAFLVLTTAGVDAGSYSFSYVAGWSDGHTDWVAHTAHRVITCARQIIAGLGLDSDNAVA
jgi:antirestriction protein ArdC